MTQQIDSVTTVEVVTEDEDEYDSDNDERKYFQEKEGSTYTGNITPRKMPEDRVKALKEDDDFWYANAQFEEVKKKETNPRYYTPLGQRAWFQTLLWFIIISGFATFLILYLSSNNVGLFRKKDRTVEEAGEEELETGDIFAINFQKEIDRATAQGNFRLAIRLMYLRLLKEMSDRKIINYTQDKTNFDYLLQVHTTPYYKDFFRITRHYEYSWYGLFDVNEAAYKVVQQDVNQFERELK